VKTKEVVDYYENTRFDYRVAWLSRDNPAIHFGYYDEKARFHKEALLRLNEVMADLAAIRPGELVLDAGCGLGGSSLWLAAKRGAFVTGITPVPGQVREASRKAGELGLSEQVFFEVADYHHTPFSAGSFDVVWACESLCHSPRKTDFYQEAFRLLKPGGRLVIAEYMRITRPLSQPQEELLNQWLQGWAIPDIDTAEEHRNNAQHAGFEAIEIRDITAHTRISHRNLHKQARRWWRVGQALRLLGIRNRIQHRNHRGALRQFEALEAGAWFYGLGRAVKQDWTGLTTDRQD
jgi:cyclopropane fatty-acyl-phospholipid synthase-like methyltransferase